MKNWNEIRTAYQVAKLGTVTSAAEALGVHRATVIRHIDALEKVFGQKLFLRHTQGYTPTDAGRDLMQVADSTDKQFAQLIGRNTGRSAQLSGELIITSVQALAAVSMPAIQEFQVQHPNIQVIYEMNRRVFALEYGEAHIALRMGVKPTEPNNVVQLLMKYRVGLYASTEYMTRYGLPKSKDEFARHKFVRIIVDKPRTPFEAWHNKHVSSENICFLSKEPFELHQAVLHGVGIGFFPIDEVSNYPQLVEVLPRENNWEMPVWLVTHIDQHRTAKVQTFLQILKNQNA